MGHSEKRDATFESGIRLCRGWGNRAFASAVLASPGRWSDATLDIAMAHPEAFDRLDPDGITRVLDSFEMRARG